MSMFQLETRPSSPSRIGHAMLVGVCIAVGLMFAARWFVAWDYQNVSVGDKVDSDIHTFRGTVQSIEGGDAVVRDIYGQEKTIPVLKLTEL